MSGLTGEPLHLALAAPTAALVLTGLWNASPYFFGLAVVILREEYIARHPTKKQPKPRRGHAPRQPEKRVSWLEWIQRVIERLTSLSTWKAVLICVGLFVAALTFGMQEGGVRAGLVDSLGLLIFAFVVVVGVRLRGKKVVLARTWPLIILLLFFGAVVGGVGGSVFPSIQVAYYRFAPSQGAPVVPAGWYADLGETGGLIYLRSCSAGTTGLVAIPPNSVGTVQFANVPNVPSVADAGNPSLWQAVAHQAAVSFGISNPCPLKLPPPPSHGT